jgi:outer membrane biosynthesis protein TonB
MAVNQLNKGEKAILLGFTGIRLAEVEIAKATKKEFTVIKANGDEMIFNRETGIQTNVAEGKEKYANKLVHPDDAPAPKAKKAPAKKAAPKKAPKVEEPEVEEDEVDDVEEEEEKPKKKPAKKPAAKKPAKKKVEVVEEDEDDDDDYEEL